MLNKLTIIGHLGKDPEVKLMNNGGKICTISVATTDSWKDKQTGEKKEAVEWHHCVFYNQLSDIASKYLKKGSKVYIEGSLKTTKWADKEGKTRYTTNVVCREMKMLDSAPDRNGVAAQAPAQQQGASDGFNNTSIPF